MARIFFSEQRTARSEDQFNGKERVMDIAGLQKLSLLDYPGKICCIVFTAGCNFRCPFCHNAAVVNNTLPQIPESEVLTFLEKRKNLLEGVCVSGGEPLLQSGLEQFLAKIKALGYAVKLDTNGSFPDRFADLINANLIDYVAMDIKNTPQKYALTVGCGVDYSLIEQSAKIIMSSGINYELRTTLVKQIHTPADIEQIGQAFKGAKRFYLQNFAASNDLLGNIPLTPLTDGEMKAALEIIKRHIPNAEIR